MSNKWQRGAAEEKVLPFKEEMGKIGPRHPQWQLRVKAEIVSLTNYLSFLKDQFPRPWFQLKPDPDPKYNFMIWKGFIQIPARPEIKFDMVILLSSEYPNVIPRCFLDSDIVEYAGKLYLKNTFTDPLIKKNYVMICHDHMGEVEDAWAPNLSIAHFFIREVWFWFGAMQNMIIAEWDKKHKK